MKSQKSNKSLRKKKRKMSRKKTKPNLVQNYILQKPQKHQVILNKNGVRTNSDDFQEELGDITSRAFKYANNARILGNELFLLELNKNV